VQIFFTIKSSILMLLSSRVQRLILPIQEYRHYVGSRQLLAELMPIANTSKLTVSWTVPSSRLFRLDLV